MFKCEVVDFLKRAGIKFKEDNFVYDNDEIDLAHDMPATYTPVIIADGGVELWFDPGDESLLGTYESKTSKFHWKK